MRIYQPGQPQPQTFNQIINSNIIESRLQVITRSDWEESTTDGHSEASSDEMRMSNFFPNTPSLPYFQYFKCQVCN